MRYDAPALVSAAELAGKYINERRLPDKAIDVIDQAGPPIVCVPRAVARSDWARRTSRASSRAWRAFPRKVYRATIVRRWPISTKSSRV